MQTVPSWFFSRRWITTHISWTKLKINFAYADRPVFRDHGFILCRQFWCRTSPCFTDQVTLPENLQGGTSSLVGQFLHPISLVQSSRSIQHMQTIQLFLNMFLFSCASNLDVGTVYASRIRKLRKRICWVEPAPLWASSYTDSIFSLVQSSRSIGSAYSPGGAWSFGCIAPVFASKLIFTNSPKSTERYN